MQQQVRFSGRKNFISRRGLWTCWLWRSYSRLWKCGGVVTCGGGLECDACEARGCQFPLLQCSDCSLWQVLRVAALSGTATASLARSLFCSCKLPSLHPKLPIIIQEFQQASQEPSHLIGCPQSCLRRKHPKQAPGGKEILAIPSRTDAQHTHTHTTSCLFATAAVAP